MLPLKHLNQVKLISILPAITMKYKTACQSLRLPVLYDVGRLVGDLQICLRSAWTDHFNRQDYQGDWNSVALYSVSGNAEDIMTSGEGTFIATRMLSSCAYFKEILDNLSFEKESVRLLRLAAGSVVLEHRDRGLAYENGVFRLHIPLQTEADVDFVVGGKRMEMTAGECWYANFDLPHSVNNRSMNDRVHLVIDGIRNEWTDNLFRQAGYDFEEEQKVLAPDDATFDAMVAALEQMNTETSRKIIEELKAKRNAV